VERVWEVEKKSEEEEKKIKEGRHPVASASVDILKYW